jgi:alkylation response protein AidB-like acyl-CoA dehydrogenase
LLVYFALTPEQRRRQQDLCALLNERMPEAAVRELMADPAGDNPGLWPEVARLGVAEDPAEIGAALEVLGERLYVGPYLSSAVLGAFLLSRAGKADALAAVRSGRLRVAVAVADDSGEPTPQGVSVSEDGKATGSRSFVIDGMTADRVVVSGMRRGVPCLVEIETDAAGLTRNALASLDQTRKLARLELAAAPGRVLDVDAAEELENLRLVTHAAVAAEQLGCAQGAFDVALAYAKGRQQFGRVIGSYQAVKHRFAELALQIEQARAAAYHALLLVGSGPASAPAAVSHARLLATQAAVSHARIFATQAAVSHARIVATQAALEASEWCVQVQGGQGFRWDNVAHLYLKRAKASQLLFGDPARERERIEALLDLG